MQAPVRLQTRAMIIPRSVIQVELFTRAVLCDKLSFIPTLIFHLTIEEGSGIIWILLAIVYVYRSFSFGI